MNELKIKINPYLNNNPFDLKDNQIHYFSTNKNEDDIRLILQKKDLSNLMILIQLNMENYSYAYLHTSSNDEYELLYYNDFDDYEDEIEFASDQWLKMVMKSK